MARFPTPIRSVTTSEELPPDMAEELLAVFSEYGFSAKYGRSPAGSGPSPIDFTRIDVAATAFLTTFVTLFAKDAYAKLKEFITAAYRRPRVNRHGDMRPAVFLVRDDWFSMGREVNITLEPDLPDEAYVALFAVDVERLASTQLKWSREQRRWTAEPASRSSVRGPDGSFELTVISVSRANPADQTEPDDGWEVVATEETEVATFYWVRRYRPATSTPPDELKKLVIPRRNG